jgi:hypothetical protein
MPPKRDDFSGTIVTRPTKNEVSVVVVGGEARFSGIALAPQHEGRPLRGSI